MLQYFLHSEYIFQIQKTLQTTKNWNMSELSKYVTTLKCLVKYHRILIQTHNLWWNSYTLNILHLCIFATLISKSASHIVINFNTAIMIDKVWCVAFNISKLLSHRFSISINDINNSNLKQVLVCSGCVGMSDITIKYLQQPVIRFVHSSVLCLASPDS